MNTPVRPTNVAPPNANYELAMRTSPDSQFLHTAGIVGFEPDGTVATTLARQAARVWEIVEALLTEGGFVRTDVVSYTTYVVNGEDLGIVMAARDTFFGDHRAASVLVTVPALAQPAWLIEVAAVAAR